ncbi:type VI secretion system ATPase TssH [Caulobacter sp. KR2-114]|uniref:type VI secretion system ATPase TssH n=1 Tax=Caulobacter sp. KR2-114 TaxID=3400912 RepID=UPI003C03CF10
MAGIDLRSLVAKLNDPCRQALEAAAGMTLSRTHYNVEIEHYLLKLLDIPGGDFQTCLTHYGVDLGALGAGLNKVLDRLKTGNSRPPALAPQVVTLVREAWILASLGGGASKIRSGHLLAALLNDDGLAAVAREASAEFAKVPAEALRNELANLTQGTSEDAAGSGQVPEAEAGAQARMAGGALDQYTIDLTARAKAGKIDPVLGRDAEIRQVIDILTRRRQNNPILTGEPGVGKTAVAEGFALRIAAGDVPPSMQNVVLRTLDLSLLQAGAGMKGEFENRLKSVIEEVRNSPVPIILFIDEAHTLVGAGGAAGQGDAANLLKPALARGELRTVAATTWAEYKKYFERDAALARRFQPVVVEEPGLDNAVAMMRGMVKTLEEHHKVRILDEAVVESVRLSMRYIPARQLPDKSISVLDTACARVAMSQAATPGPIEDCRRRIELLTTGIGILEREATTGVDHAEALDKAAKDKAAAEAELADLEQRWAREKILVADLRKMRDALEAAAGQGAGDKPAGDPAAATEAAPPAGDAAAGETPPAEDPAALRERYKAAQAELAALQGERPLMQVSVDGQAVAEVIANWTGIPLGRMVANEIQTVLDLKPLMGKRIIGQDHALEAIAMAMRTSRAKLTDPRKPTGVFLMVGTSGVGKTETALTLAELLYGGGQNLTVINMSEFKEEHKVSMLLGSPPGYVGFGEGGVLTEAVRRRPYSVVLLDEMEKAHPGVQDVFYQVFDKGQLRDGEGRDIDFKNSLIIMTSNAGTDTIAKLCADPETMPDEAGLLEALRPELLKIFKPAFLGRVTIVPYFPLSDETLRKIVELQLGRIGERILENYGATFSYPPELVDHVVAGSQVAESGARAIENMLSRGVLPEISERFLERMAQGQSVRSVGMSLDNNGVISYRLE